MDMKRLVEALVMIEGIALITDPAVDYVLAKDKKKYIKRLARTLGDIYRISHIATEHCEGCKGGNVAKQDKRRISYIKRQLKKYNTVDVDKAVKEIMAP